MYKLISKVNNGNAYLPLVRRLSGTMVEERALVLSDQAGPGEDKQGKEKPTEHNLYPAHHMEPQHF